MSGGPDFFDLIGDEGSPEELERLRRTHDLLVAAGPPPELSPRLADAPPTQARAGWLPRRRRGAAFLLAGAAAAAAFGIGFLVGGRNSTTFPSNRSPIAMHAVTAPEAAHASILIGERDEVGNWPLLVHASGLKPLPQGQWYELYLTRNGKITDWCGAFDVQSSGETSVRLSVPYSLQGNVGWVVTSSAAGRHAPVLLTT